MTSLPLSRRIFFLFSTAFILLLGLTSLIIYAFFSNLLVSRTEDYLHLVMQQNQFILNSYFSHVDKIASDISNDRFLYQSLSEELSDRFVDQTITRQTLNRYLITAVYVPLRKYFDSVNYWFFVDDSMPVSKLYTDYSYPGNHVVVNDKAQDLAFYARTLEAGGKVYWFFDQAKPTKIYAACLIRGSFSATSITQMGILLLEFDIADLFGDIQQATLTDNSVYFFVDSSKLLHEVLSSNETIGIDAVNQVLMENDTLATNSVQISTSFRAESHFFSVLPLDSSWLLVGVTPFSDLLEQTQRVSEFLLPLTIVSLLLVLLLSFFIAQSVSKPITRLSQIMQTSANESNLDISLPQHQETLEIAALYHSYTMLIHRIKILLQEVYDRGVSEKQAEIRMLQAQINPHFLYNTLDSVSWAALDLGNKEIPAVVSSLSNILRYSIKEPDKLATLSEELEIAQNYVEIQRFCYSLDIVVDVSGERIASNYLLPKLTLQPLVENAIIHGFLERGQKKGRIAIRFTDGADALVCEVENEGKADILAMNEILQSKTLTAKHGIRNVHTRLQMMFGEESGLSFIQSGDASFVVRMVIHKTTPATRPG